MSNAAKFGIGAVALCAASWTALGYVALNYWLRRAEA